ncbi:PH domain-containing protein [Shouchella shacheensis]|uniref:PH domain-containing protein n=1 Tax=Shouchella shacheensis TaxID=1649580 RepID=UPI00073FE064|nr:PH domain-containing protein [Shouchella shacheensis]
MRKEPSQRLPKKAIQVWRIQNSFDTLFFALFPVAYGLLGYFFFENLPSWILWGLIGVVLLYGLARIVIWPQIQWYRFRYEVLDEEIDIRQGVVIVRRTLIPMVRVQHVDTEQGPILRRYKMAAVSITSAATTHSIPTLFLEDADALRDQIAELASVNEDE